jgi:CheY-like chemotaxis protein
MDDLTVDKKIHKPSSLNDEALHDIRNYVNTIIGYSQILKDEKECSSQNSKLVRSIENAALHIKSHISSTNNISAQESKNPKDTKKSLKVLIVDDNHDNRTIIKMIIKKLPVEILMADSANKAIEIVQKEFIDLIFMDINLPDMSGVEASAIIKKSMPDLPIYAVSGDIQTVQNDVKNNKDFASFLLKPFNREDIKQILHRYLEKPSNRENKQEQNSPDNSHKILIIDDKEENLELFKDILKPYRYNIMTLSNPHEALDVAQEFMPELILLDVVMPEMDGHQVLEELKSSKLTKDIPTIFLTANDSPEDIVKGLEAGVADYISKPFHPKELIARVNTHLQKSRLMSNLKKMLEQTFHELYTPLSVITSAMQMQELEFGDTNYTKMSLAASKTLKHIYDDLYYSMNYFENKTNEELFDLSELISQRVNYFKLVADSKELLFDVSLDAQISLRSVQKDIERVIDNLLSNAIKYTQQNSVISIMLSLDEEKTRFSISNPTKKDIDTSKIFQKYYRDEKDVFGLGLGLELVESLCQKHKIKITPISKDKHFTITLDFQGLR